MSAPLNTQALPAALAFLQGLDMSTALDPASAQAIDAATEPWGLSADAMAALAADPTVCLLDVRRAGARGTAPELIPGSHWCNPVQIGSRQAPADAARTPSQAVVVYCVHGHAVSRSAVLALRAQGHVAHFLSGGITAWVASGRPTITADPGAGAAL